MSSAQVCDGWGGHVAALGFPKDDTLRHDRSDIDEDAERT